MNPLEINIFWNMFTIVMLIGITAWYLWLINIHLENSKKEREIKLIKNKLEKFYIPLQNSLFSIGETRDDIRREILNAKASSLNRIVKKVKYQNFSSRELRSLIRRFTAKFQFFDYPIDLDKEVGIGYDEMAYLFNKIEALVSRDIKEFHRKLDELHT